MPDLAVVGARRGSQLIAHAADPGRLARLVYTYIHLPIVAGIIVTAVGDELVLAHPSGHASPAAIAAVLGGPALYLAGNLLFKRATADRLPLSHLGGLALLALLVPLGTIASPLLTATGATLVLVLVAAWEWRSLGQAPAEASRTDCPSATTWPGQRGDA